MKNTPFHLLIVVVLLVTRAACAAPAMIDRAMVISPDRLMHGAGRPLLRTAGAVLAARAMHRARS